MAIYELVFQLLWPVLDPGAVHKFLPFQSLHTLPPNSRAFSPELSSMSDDVQILQGLMSVRQLRDGWHHSLGHRLC